MRRIRAMARRIVMVYRAASAAVKAEGRDWYRKARLTAWSMARECGVTLRTAAGVLAAISPRLTWRHNVNAARALLTTGVCSGVFKTSKAKALRIMAGESPLKVLGGPKVRAFYRALTGHDAAVVDVWMTRAAGLRSPQVSDATYRDVVSALKLASAEVGERVAAMQAIAWVQVRGRAA